MQSEVIMIECRCEFCEKSFKRAGFKKGRFCSVSCKAKYQATQKPVNKEWLYQKYIVEGLSTYEIGAIVKRDPKRVYEWLKGYEIETRPRGDNLKDKDNYMKNPDAINPFFGKTHTEKTKRLLSKAASRPRPHLRGKNNGMYGKMGELNPRYIDGSSPERQKIYASSEWKAVARQVKKRDSYRCVKCGNKPLGYRNLHIHHIKTWAGNTQYRLDPSNLVCLCRECHKWVHSSANVGFDFLDKD
jgi:hypothetical protein